VVGLKFIGKCLLGLLLIGVLQYAVVETRCFWMVDDPLNVLGCATAP